MITIIENNELTSEIHVHAAGCSHITRSEVYFSQNFAKVMSTDNYENIEQAAIDYFGEIAADQFEWGTREWLNEVMFEWKMNTRIFPCAK